MRRYATAHRIGPPGTEPREGAQAAGRGGRGRSRTIAVRLSVCWSARLCTRGRPPSLQGVSARCSWTAAGCRNPGAAAVSAESSLSLRSRAACRAAAASFSTCTFRPPCARARGSRLSGCRPRGEPQMRALPAAPRRARRGAQAGARHMDWRGACAAGVRPRPASFRGHGTPEHALTYSTLQGYEARAQGRQADDNTVEPRLSFRVEPLPRCGTLLRVALHTHSSSPLFARSERAPPRGRSSTWNARREPTVPPRPL